MLLDLKRCMIYKFCRKFLNIGNAGGRLRTLFVKRDKRAANCDKPDVEQT